METSSNIIEILQTSIVPTVLISGVGLLILSINNRVIHILDRIRKLIDDYVQTNEKYLEQEIDLLYKRAKLIRFSIYNLVLSIILDVFVIFSIFISKTTSLDLSSLIIMFFTLSMLALIIGLIALLRDVNRNLHALKIEISNRVNKNKRPV